MVTTVVLRGTVFEWRSELSLDRIYLAIWPQRRQETLSSLANRFTLRIS
jgi:hypothetical protein